MKLVALFLAFSMAGFGSCSVKAQTVQTTPNLITGGWSNANNSTTTGGGFSGGSSPAYNPSTNTIYFGYTQSTVAQTFAINQALSGSGVQVGGYNYSWQYLNNSSTGGTLSSTIKLTSPTGTTLESYSYGMNVIADGWRTMSGTQNFQKEYGLADVGNLNIAFTGKDARFWAGYYGPQVKNVNLSLNYTADPCASNPLYSPSCPNYNQVLTSQNILGNQYGVQSYAINQALALSGSGVQINGFKYGYDMYVGGDWCYFGFIICLDTRPSSMAVDVNVTSAVGTSLYSATHDHTQQNTFGSYSYTYVFPTKQPLASMGNFELSARQFGTGAMYSSWSNWQYTPDPCVVDPLSSQACPGYQQAFLTQQCTANPLYNSTCPGYAAALFTQQCSANPLMNPTCPGYANAYLTYQCSINPLYSTTCVGYETAYFNQQCSLDATYNTRCPGYAAAYKTKQCTASPLYATDCPGYEQAYLNSQCIKDSLYSNKCEGYATAYAIKNLITFSDSTVSSSVNGALSDTAAVKANDPATTKVAVNTVATTVNTDGTVSTGVSATGDTNVDKAITSKASTTNTAPAAVQLAPPPPAPAQQMAQNEPKGGDKPEPKNNDKPEGKRDEPSGGAPQMAQQPQGGESKPAAPTARQEIQARREAAAKADAVEKGKNLANEMGKAADMESQKAVQNVVIQAMGFTPGFDVYNRALIVDSPFYKPVSIYNNQKNIDNRANLRMFGGTDRLHNEMVDSQYNKGN